MFIKFLLFAIPIFYFFFHQSIGWLFTVLLSLFYIGILGIFADGSEEERKRRADVNELEKMLDRRDKKIR